MHVHVSCADGEAKFWLTPDISLAANQGLSHQQVNEIMKIVEERRDDIESSWNKHFSG